jgi:hypothetical protein
MGIAPTIEAPAINRDALYQKHITFDFPIEEDVVFTPSVVVAAPKAAGHSPDTAAPILAVLAASQELSLSDMEPASSEHGSKKGLGVNPAEEITTIDPPASDNVKNIPEWIGGGNESFGYPQKSKVGLFAGIGIGLFFAAGIVFFIARGKEKPSQTSAHPPSVTTPTKLQGTPEPEPTPLPPVAQKPIDIPPPVAKTAPVDVPGATAEKTAPIIKPAQKPAMAEKQIDKPAPTQKIAAPVTKPVRAEKSIEAEKPVASAKPLAKATEAPKAEPKAVANLNAKNLEEKLQKAVEAYQRGNTKLFQGNLVEAIADFKLAIRLNPKEPTPYRGLGLAFAQQGKTGEAVTHLKRYLNLAPKAPDRALIEKRIQQLQ